jgi:hypothetical protein
MLSPGNVAGTYRLGAAKSASFHEAQLTTFALKPDATREIARPPGWLESMILIAPQNTDPHRRAVPPEPAAQRLALGRAFLEDAPF